MAMIQHSGVKSADEGNSLGRIAASANKELLKYVYCE